MMALLLLLVVIVASTGVDGACTPSNSNSCLASPNYPGIYEFVVQTPATNNTYVRVLPYDDILVRIELYAKEGEFIYTEFTNTSSYDLASDNSERAYEPVLVLPRASTWYKILAWTKTFNGPNKPNASDYERYAAGASTPLTLNALSNVSFSLSLSPTSSSPCADTCDFYAGQRCLGSTPTLCTCYLSQPYCPNLVPTIRCVNATAGVDPCASTPPPTTSPSSSSSSSSSGASRLYVSAAAAAVASMTLMYL